jgi:hypothetical protein
MKRFGMVAGVAVLVALVLMVVSPAWAAWRSASWNNNDQDLYGANSIQKAVDEFDARFDGSASDSNRNIRVNSIKVDVETAVTVTNGQPVTLSGGINRLTAAASKNNGTNTITLVSGTTNTNGVFLIVNTGTTNLLAIAKTGTWKSAAVELGFGDAMLIFKTATNEFRGLE